MFDTVKKMVLGFLGIDAFNKVEGKSVLTDDQKKKIEEKYGDKFLNSFISDLQAFEKDGTDNFESQVSSRIEALAAENKKIREEMEALAKAPEEDPPAEVNITDGKRVVKVNPNSSYRHNKAAVAFLKGDASHVVAGDTIDADEVVSEFGDLLDYFKPDTLQKAMTTFDTAKYLTWKRAIHSYKATKAIITSVVQQFTNKWTPSGKSTFTPIEIPLYRMKINLPITPSELEDWIFAMYDESKDISQMPVTKYILGTLLRPRVEEDIELKMIATGNYEDIDWSTVTEGDDGQVPEKSMNGFMTILKDKKSAGTSNINFLLKGETITENNIVDKFNDFVDAIDEVYVKKNMPIFCSHSTYRKYKRAYKKLYGSDSGDPEFGKDVIDYSNNRLTPLPSMAGEEGFFSTPKENFIGLRHKNEATTTKAGMMKTDPYSLKVFAEFRLGVGFTMEEAVFAYIPDDSDSGSGSAT